MKPDPGAGDARQRLGRAGESTAETILERGGLTVIDRRFRRCGAEIDLIAVDDEMVVFVEVKTRSGTGYGMPAEAVTATKRRRLARAALAFLARRGWLERPSRFDVVAVEVRGERVLRVQHLVDAFRPEPIDPHHRRSRSRHG